jgi:hypothetical protein
MDPTLEGFQSWVEAIMAVPEAAMPDCATLQIAYDGAINLCYIELRNVPSQSTSMSIYAQSVYNLGGALLVEFAADVPGSTFWSDLRTKLGLNNFTPGLINQAHDQGTGEGTYIIKQLEGLTLFGLQLLKTPWGRAYMMIVGQWGPIWGLTV